MEPVKKSTVNKNKPMRLQCFLDGHLDDMERQTAPNRKNIYEPNISDLESATSLGPFNHMFILQVDASNFAISFTHLVAIVFMS